MPINKNAPSDFVRSTMPGTGKTPYEGSEWAATLAHHDAAIGNLSHRMTGVETGMRTLQGEVHSGFSALKTELSALNGGLSKLDAQPKINLHQAVSTVLALAVLFSMVVGGIIWVTTSQFAGVIAEQKAFNSAISNRAEKIDARVDKNETSIDKIRETIGHWLTTIEGRRADASQQARR